MGESRSLDQATEGAVQLFMSRIAGFHPVRALLFGSRARGTHTDESDADVAILLNGEVGPFVRTKLAMADVAYDVLLETGINISPLPVWMDEWNDPERYSNPALLHEISRDGVEL